PPGRPPRPADSAAPLQVREDLARRILSGLPRDPAARVGSRRAQVEPVDGEAIPRAPEERPPEEPLVEGLLAVERVAAAQAVVALEVQRRDHLAGTNARGETRRQPVEDADDAIREGVRSAIGVPRALPERAGRVLGEDADHVRARRRALDERRVDEG